MEYKAFEDVSTSRTTTDSEGRIRVAVIASSSRVDRNSESVAQNFDISDFLKNPVLLWNHARDKSTNFYAGIPIGHCENVKLVDGHLECDLVFATAKANPLAPIIANSFLEKSIRAVSIGFNFSHSVQNGEVQELHGAQLVEISACVIPVNPDAVAKALELRKTELTHQLKRYKLAQKEKSMEMTQDELNKFLSQIAALLGVAAESTPEQILQAMTEKLGTTENGATEVLSETESSDLKEAAAKICSMKMVLSEMQAKSLAEKSKEPSITAQRIEEKIKKAVDSGILQPSKIKAVKEYADKYGEKALDDHLALTSKSFAVAPSRVLSIDSGKRTSVSMSVQEQSILKQLGLKAEDLV